MKVKFEKALFLSTTIVNFILECFKPFVKASIYSLTIIYASASVCGLLSMLVPMEVMAVSAIANLVVFTVGIAVGSISGKILLNCLKKISKEIFEIRNRMCKNFIFCFSMEHGDIEAIMKSLNYGPNVNVRIHGRTPLIIAIERKNITVMERLLELGADINATDLAGFRPLTIAIKRENIPIIERLLELEANVNALDSHSKYKLLTIAVKTGDISTMRKLELGVNCIDGRLLCFAYESRNKNMLDILHSKGADFGLLLNNMQDVIADNYFYEVVTQYLNREVRDLYFAINKFRRSEEGFIEDVIETKLNKFRVFLDTSKRVVNTNKFKICNLKDTSKFKDIWLDYNYDLNQIILNFYWTTKIKVTNELRNNGIQHVDINREI